SEALVLLLFWRSRRPPGPVEWNDHVERVFASRIDGARALYLRQGRAPRRRHRQANQVRVLGEELLELGARSLLAALGGGAPQRLVRGDGVRFVAHPGLDGSSQLLVEAERLIEPIADLRHVEARRSL